MKPFQYSFLVDFKCPRPSQVDELFSRTVDCATQKMREHRVDIDVLRPQMLKGEAPYLGAMAVFVVSASRDVAESVQYAVEDMLMRYVAQFDFGALEMDFAVGDLQAHKMPDEQIDRALVGRLEGLNERAVEGLFQLKDLIEKALDAGLIDEHALGDAQLFEDLQDCLVDINRQTSAKSMLAL